MANRSQMYSAGVYPNEVDNSQYTSSTTSNMVGIVGVANRGPLVPTVQTSSEELLKTYGDPDEKYYGLFAALAVLDAGGPVIFQRVAHTGTFANNEETGAQKVVFTAKNSGTGGNKVSVKITKLTDKVGEYDVDIMYDGEVVESFTELNNEEDSSANMQVVINSCSSYVTIDSITKLPESDSETFTLTGGTDTVAKAVAGDKGTDYFVFETRTYDSTLNGAIVTISAKDELGFRKYELRKGTTIIETFSSLNDVEGSDREVATFINKYSEYIVCDKVEANKGSYTEKACTFLFKDGLNGVDGVDDYDVVGAGNSGMSAFADNEAYPMRSMCTPGYCSYYVIKSGLQICEKRGDCVFVFDGEEDMTPAQIVNWSNGIGAPNDAFNSSFGALYYPWLKVYDSFHKKEVYHPACGYVCAQYVINDTIGEVYDAPAGITRGTIKAPIGVKRVCTKLDRDLLYGNRNIVNPIASFPSYGIVIWGQKTCQRVPSVFDRLNNRRLFNYLITTIKESTLDLVFEGNQKLTWDRWISRVEPIIARIKDDNGIEDYRLAMGETTISMNDKENHIMPGRIEVKCINTAEFIPIDFIAYNSSYVFPDEDEDLIL